MVVKKASVSSARYSALFDAAYASFLAGGLFLVVLALPRDEQAAYMHVIEGTKSAPVDADAEKKKSQ